MLTHPLVVGELAMGNLRQRETVLGALQALPRAVVASDDDVLAYVERKALHGQASATLMHICWLPRA